MNSSFKTSELTRKWLGQHDAVLDYYGRRLATCSSDKTIKIFEIEGDQHRLTETLKGYVMSVFPLSSLHLTTPPSRCPPVSPLRSLCHVLL